ncbi:MAG: GNAT family N-acetyltransferase, partial [Propionibacteriaceae bacterium]|nr:GNAT family N-acetyltransferase [Propionibacteriaceae bacterium]
MREPQVDWTIRPAAPEDQVEPPSASGFAMVAQTHAGAVVGQAQVLESDGSFHLIEVFVAPGHRRLGIGTALLSAVESEVISRGASAVTLLASEPAAIDFFTRLGFVELPQLPVALRWLDAGDLAS